MVDNVSIPTGELIQTTGYIETTGNNTEINGSTTTNITLDEYANKNITSTSSKTYSNLEVIPFTSFTLNSLIGLVLLLSGIYGFYAYGSDITGGGI